MKQILLALTLAPCVALVTTQLISHNGKRELTFDELSAISGGDLLSDCNTTSCPNAGS